MSDHTPQLRIVEELWVKLSAVDAARDRRARRSVARRRGLRTALLVVLTLLALAAIAVAARAWLFGAPAPSSPPLPSVAGRLLPGTVRLLSLRTTDPGGGPTWGLRVSMTSSHFGCIQAGRVVDGRLVALGIDDSFRNDGRAHPLPLTSENCGGVDDADHLRVSGSPPIVAASGAIQPPNCETPDERRGDRANVTVIRQTLRNPPAVDDARTLRGLRALLRRKLYDLAHPRKRCAARTLRTVIMGVAGPAARRITLFGPGRTPAVETVRPGDGGGYLFVIRGRSGLGALTMSVHYANGLICPVDQPFTTVRALGPRPRACSTTLPGYVYKRHPQVPTAPNP